MVPATKPITAFTLFGAETMWHRKSGDYSDHADTPMDILQALKPGDRVIIRWYGDSVVPQDLGGVCAVVIQAAKKTRVLVRTGGGRELRLSGRYLEACYDANSVSFMWARKYAIHDPEAKLATLRGLLAKADRGDWEERDTEEFTESFRELDTWLTSGGRKPGEWGGRDYRKIPS